MFDHVNRVTRPGHVVAEISLSSRRRHISQLQGGPQKHTKGLVL